jgi:hypothetical protein
MCDKSRTPDMVIKSTSSAFEVAKADEVDERPLG